VQRVEHREKTLARHSENPIASVDAKLVDKNAAAGACGHGSGL